MPNKEQKKCECGYLPGKGGIYEPNCPIHSTPTEIVTNSPVTLHSEKQCKQLPCRCGKRGAQCMVHYPPFPVDICGMLVHASQGIYCANPMPCSTHTVEKGFNPTESTGKWEGTCGSSKLDGVCGVTNCQTHSSPTKPDPTELKLNKDVIIDHGKHCKCNNCKAFYKPDSLKEACNNLVDTIKKGHETDKLLSKPDTEEGVTEFNYADVIPELKSKPDTEEWEKEFYNKFYKGVAVINYQPEHEDYQSLSLIEIEDFVRQEKEKSYKEGLYRGYEEEAVGCHKHCEQARKEGYVQGGKDEREFLLNQKANKHDQEVRHSAYREILEMVEQMKLVLRPSKEDSMTSAAFQALLSNLGEKLTQK